MERAKRRLFPKRAGPPEAAGHGAEMNLPPWHTHLAALASAGLGGMTRRLPTLIGAAARLAWQASPADAVATVTLHLLAGVFTAYGLLATTGVLRALFAGGATPDRVRAALPSLILVAGATALRAALQAGAGWAQARLKPRVDHLV
jgi:ATP-binding cassette subfamily B protein/ATP-binding cassette subfamily C protein